MTYQKTIMAFGILIGAILLKKTNPIILKVILIGLILSFITPFLKNQFLMDIGFYSFGVFTLIFILFMGFKKKWISLIIGAFASISFFFSFMGIPFKTELKMLMIIPILIYAFCLSKWRKHLNELSISTVLVSYEITELQRVIFNDL